MAGSVIALVIGFVFLRFHLEKWVEPMVSETRISQLRADGHVPTWIEQVEAARGGQPADRGADHRTRSARQITDSYLLALAVTTQ